jgi:F-type H+-transporting ATPase subunit h
LTFRFSQAKDAHVGVVKKYSPPTAPKPPMLPVDLASELSAYDVAEPTLAEKNVVSEEENVETGADAYLHFLEQDLPKPEAHH